jgi:tripartite-type tricarboxylate transporter receptor subunit TctC
MRRPKPLRLVALAAALLAFAGSAAAEDYPAKPVKWVVPYTPAGTTDILARIVGQYLSDHLGQQFVIDNRPGAGNNIGTEVVVNAPPDGYTLLLVNPANGINATLYKKLPFNFLRDIAPVAGIVRVPNVMEVTPGFPAKTVAEFVAYGKAHPGKINMASSGNGTSVHLSGELFMAMSGMKMTHVPYRGSGPALNDLMAGQIMIMFETPASTVGFIRAGKIRALAVNSPERCSALPEVPTMAEAGVPDYVTYTWNGLFAPARTPRAIIDRLNRATVEALADPAVRARLTELGTDVASSTPEALGALVKSELAKWAPIVRVSGAKVD